MAFSAGMSREQAFRVGVSMLKEAGIRDSALDAAVLLGHAAGRTGCEVLLDREEPLTDDQVSLYGELIERRCARETVSRIMGSREFYSRPFRVTREVLDPRPDTELLAEGAIAWLTAVGAPVSVVEVGTGCGAVAVTVAAEVPAARVVATDISRPALEVAAHNAAENGVMDRIQLIQSDMGAGLAMVPTFDLLISNPPYVARRDWAGLEDEVRRGDPLNALVSGPAGTEFYGPLASLATSILRPGGCIMVEVGSGQAEEVSRIFYRAGLIDIRTARDLGGVERVVTGTVKNA